MTEPPPGQPPEEPSEEEVRAALEEQLRQLTVDDMVLESAVSLINLGGRKAGLAPGTEGERDLEQLRSAVEAVRALLPILEQGKHAEQLGPLRDALSRLQMVYAQGAAEGGGGGAPGGPPPRRQPEPPPKPPGGSSGLWVPGQ